MISICLTKFNNKPWDTLMIKAFKKALSEETSFCTVEEIQGYPKKNYDIIFLIGIRVIVSLSFDQKNIAVL